ncbi:TonB-dependent Receptor Plug Domain protein [bacterium BMS3Bbin03]|nr:TonB-dependent Receptor Plug Domain protein [bacterium BMS3Bbin03]
MGLKKILFLINLFALLIGVSSVSYAQKFATLTGTVKDSSNGEPLIGVNIFLENTTLGAATDVNGFYVIPAIPPGNYRVVFQYMGYRTLKKKLRFLAGQRRILHIALRETVLKFGQIRITAEKEEGFDRTVEPGVITISPRELQKMPAFIESDIFRSLQMLPSVKSSGDYNAALYVRGSNPSENLTLLDGITIYNPYHLFGLFSTFNTDAVKEVNFQVGGFPVRYGNRNSSILRVITKDGNRKFFDAEGDISLLSSKILIEGPLPHGSFSLAGRRTYFDQIMKLFKVDFPYYFYDFQGKVNVDVSQNHTLTFMGFFGNDALKPSVEEGSGDEFDFHWGNRTFGIRWRGILRPNLLVESVASASRFVISQFANADNEKVSAENSITDVTFKSNLTYFYGKKHQIEAGLEATGLTFRTIVQDAFTRFVDIRILPRYAALYLQDEYHAGKWTLQPGVRLNAYNRGNRFVVDPRLNLRYRLNDLYRFKFAAGHYTQFLTTFDLEELIHFRVFDIWLPLDKNQLPIQSDQILLGVETKIWPKAKISVEGYYKRMKNLLSFYPDKVRGDRGAGRIFRPGEGRSYGIELLVKKDYGRWFGWIGYSFSFTDRKFPKIPTQSSWHPASFDRRHSLTVSAAVPLMQNIRFGLNYVLSTGNPFTEPIGVVPIFHETGGTTYRCLVDHKNNARYPAYQRLDVSLRWESPRKKGFQIQPYLQVVNTFNRKNVFFYYPSFTNRGVPYSRKSVNGLPVFPTVGVHFKF